jgi:hypothetical protein
MMWAPLLFMPPLTHSPLGFVLIPIVGVML